MKYTEQLTFRTTEKTLNAIEQLAKEKHTSKAQIINELLEKILSLEEESEDVSNIYSEVEQRLSQKMDEKIQKIKKELEELLVKK
jgi:archaellum component FlaC